MKRKELRQHLNDGLINHGGQLLRYTLAVASQLNAFIPRPEYTGMLQKIQDDITEVRSGLAEKFVMVVGKLTGLERRIESLESSGGGDARIKNELRELQSKTRDLTTECGNLRERSMSLDQRVVRNHASITGRLEELESNIRDLTTEYGILRERNMSLEQEVEDQASIIDRLGNVIWPIPPL